MTERRNGVGRGCCGWVFVGWQEIPEKDNDSLLNVEGQFVSSRLLIEILLHFIPNSSVADDRGSAPW